MYTFSNEFSFHSDKSVLVDKKTKRRTSLANLCILRDYHYKSNGEFQQKTSTKES